MNRYFGVMACDPKGVIGQRGRIPWHLPAELAHFRKVTEGMPRFMGFYTYLSMPVHALQGRENIVFSRIHKWEKKNCPACFVSSWDEFLRLKIPQGAMVGGSQISELFLENDALESFILTHVHAEHEGNVRLSLDRIKIWPSKVLLTTPDYTIKQYENRSYKNPLN